MKTKSRVLFLEKTNGKANSTVSKINNDKMADRQALINIVVETKTIRLSKK